MLPIAAAMALASYAPKIVGWLTNSEKAEDIAEKVLEVGRAITGQESPAEVVGAMKDSLNFQLEFQQRILDSELDFQKLAVQNATDINRTMQSEAGSEHWPTWSWRPFIGFVFGTNILISTITVSVVYIAAMLGNAAALGAISSLPDMISALALVNGAALPVLGVASWFRGKMQADPAIPQPTKLPLPKRTRQ
jgi:hypothetical protein